jgi:hypothetical protein
MGLSFQFRCCLLSIQQAYWTIESTAVATSVVRFGRYRCSTDLIEYQRVREYVLPKLRERLLGLAKDRREETTRDLRRANADKLRQMTGQFLS